MTLLLNRKQVYMLRKIFEFAITEDSPLKIITKNNKEMKIKLLSYDSISIKYRFLNNNEGTIYLENIKSCECLKVADKIKFNKSILKEKYTIDNLEENIKNFESYYLEIIDLLLSIEEKYSDRIL